MSNVFADNGDLFWEAEYPAIPLKETSKEPAIGKFPQYADAMPSSTFRENWKHNFPKGNIGVVMGGGLAMLDVDGGEPYMRLVEALIGAQTCQRFGAKGMGYIVRVEKKTATQHFKNSENELMIEVIADGGQIVVPPSIHPKTGKAYEWHSKPLYEYKHEELPFVSPEKIAFMKALISMPQHMDLINGGPTNIAARDIAWRLADLVDEDTFCNALTALLPANYDGNLLDDRELNKVYRSAKEDPDRNPTSLNFLSRKKKPTPANVMLDIASKHELFTDQMGSPCISFTIEDKTKGPLHLRLDAAAAKLKHLFYLDQEKPIPALAYNEAYAVLCAKAMYESPQKQVFLRVALHEDRLIVNLGDAEGRVAIVDANGYTITRNSPVAFIGSPTMKALPVPVEDAGDALKEFQELLALSDAAFLRILAFLINCLNPRGPYLFLLMEGEQGSGKTFLCSLLKALIDPSAAPKQRFPKDEHNLMIMAKHNYLLLFDNLSGMRGDMSDALCALSSGGGFSTRTLYENEALHVFSECRPYILNGIADIANRPDLMERSVAVNLPPMPEGQRKTEEEIQQRFDELRPRLLDRLFKMASCALRRGAEVEAPTSVRMADAAKWIVAAEPATGLAEGMLLKALVSSQNDLMSERMDNNPVAATLYNVVEKMPFQGGIGGLFYLMKEDEIVAKDHSFPKTSAHLSKALKRLRPALKSHGIHVEFLARDKTGQRVCVWLDGQADSLEAAQKIWDRYQGGKKF